MEILEELQVTGYRLQVAGYRLQVTGYMLPATCYLLPATCYLLPIDNEGEIKKCKSRLQKQKTSNPSRMNPISVSEHFLQITCC
ncbi:MAG: hypothetical protein BWK80_04640 [Desulfobacteraceae bacterium IS3]|nr:MAG: hypothetical protein BWK80_04640 [Desulfobacteraceae bacterium IS3]